LVLFARTAEALGLLSEAWRKGRVRKRYRALASGRAERRIFTVELPIGPVPHTVLGTVHAVSPTGRRAVTGVRVLEQRRDAFLAEVEIETGRPHQIRIHLAGAGHPLVGDPLYPAGGVPALGTTALPGDPGYSLQASELRFEHPRTGRPLRLRSEPPPGLRRAGGRDPVTPDARRS
jgi:23S rRNA pseudouridine1911/1915/1917 synthase